MKDILLHLTRPRLVLAIVVVACATAALLDQRLTGSEWGVVCGAAMWWTGSNTAGTGKNAEPKSGGPL